MTPAQFSAGRVRWQCATGFVSTRVHSWLPTEAMPFLRIVLLAIGATIGYGIVHDQITARLCVEYFTIAHPQFFHTESPTLLAFGWGVLATWWVGLMLGVPLACIARLGRAPKLTARQFVRPILVQLAVMAICALAAGVLGWQLTARGVIRLDQFVRLPIPPEKQAAFLADGFAHNASYAIGFLGGLALLAWAAVKRFRATPTANAPQPPQSVHA